MEQQQQHGVSAGLAPPTHHPHNPLPFTWNVYNTLRLIEDLRKTPCLWDLHDPDYKRKRIKADAYRKMAHRYGSTPLQVESKIQALKNQFRREQRRLEEQSRGGMELKVPTWFGYNKLLFLLPHYHSRSNIKKEEALFENDLHLDESEFHNRLLDASLEPASWGELIGHPRPGSEEEEAGADEGDEGSVKRIRIEETKTDHSLWPGPGWRRDEFATYGEYVGNELRKLTSRSQLVVKHLINNILYEGALGKFESVVVENEDDRYIGSPTPGTSSPTIVKTEPEECRSSTND